LWELMNVCSTYGHPFFFSLSKTQVPTTISRVQSTDGFPNYRANCSRP
jgi:hypothetical protein